MSTDEALPLQNLKNAFLLIFFFLNEVFRGMKQFQFPNVQKTLKMCAWL